MQDVVLATGVPSAHCVSGVLESILFSKNTWIQTGPTKPLARVFVQNVALVPEQPDTVYISASGTKVAEVTFQQDTDAAPLLKVAPFATPIGSMLQVVLRWEQGSVAASSAQTLDLAVGLILRPA